MQDEDYMAKCFDLALKGAGLVAPNPMVGCVIVSDDKIIGEGYHEQFGLAHAEVNAINQVQNKAALRNSTLYVNLEPCAHHGKTPPCADLIIRNSIPRVVIGCSDSYSEVDGKGVAKLKSAGVEVQMNVLQKDARFLNRRFFTFHENKRPYVILKWAQSSDGYIDIDRKKGEKGTHWITGEESKYLVHQWRSEEAGILVGKNTIINDNPRLTNRLYKGPSPTRFVIDPQDELNLENFEIGNSEARTHKIHHSKIEDILNFIASKNIMSVIIEGGCFTLQAFLNSGIWDEARILTGPSIIETGMKAPTVILPKSDTYHCGNDEVAIIYND